MAKFKKDDLIAAAKEINDADILEGELKTKGSIADLQKQFEDIQGLIYPEDKESFSKPVWAVMQKLGVIDEAEEGEDTAPTEEPQEEETSQEEEVQQEDLDPEEEPEPEPEEEPEPEPEPKEEKKSSKKKNDKKGDKKPAKSKGGFRGTKIKDRMNFMEPLIEKGINRKELIEKTMKQFPDASKSAIQVIICDGKNPKYTKFGRIIVEDENKTLTFGEKV